MGPWLALVTLHAALITVRAGAAQCPSPRQVQETLSARLPGFLVPPPPSPTANILELKLVESPTEHTFVVVDSRGEVRLSGDLPASRTASTRDCEALAETVALIVDRYLQQLGYQDQDAPAVAAGPPPGPGEPRWAFFV